MKTSLALAGAFVATLMLSPLASLADDAPKPGSSVTPDARQMIDQMGQAYGKLHSLTLAGTLSINLQVSSSPAEKHSTDFTSSFAAPNRFRHEVKDDVLIGSTGQKLYTFRGQEDAYTVGDAPKGRVASGDLPKGVAGLISAQDPSLWLAMSKDPSEELASGVVSAKKVDDTKIGDDACPTVELVQKDNSVIRLSADPQSHLIREVTMDLAPRLKAQRPDLTRALVTIDYSRSTVDGSLADQSFAWSPPPGARDADAANAARPMDDSQASQLQGKPAPDFKLDGLDGKPVSLASLHGKVVVLDFWATWCPPCRASLPHLDKLYQAEKAKGVLFFAVDDQEEKAAVADFVKKTGLSVPVLLDSEGKAAGQYAASAIPETVVIGKDGNVKKVIIGFDPDQSPAELEKAVNDAAAQ